MTRNWSHPKLVISYFQLDNSRLKSSSLNVTIIVIECDQKITLMTKKTLMFEKGETEQDVVVEIIDDNEWEPDEVFFCRLTVDPEEPFLLGKKP